MSDTQQKWEPIPGPEEQSPEWLENRQWRPERGETQVQFGASDAAAVCNRSRYACALDLYLQQRQEIAPRIRPEEERLRLRRGRRMQDLIVPEYEEETGYKVITPDRSFTHPLLPFMSATPDGVVMTPQDPEHGLECKSTGEHMYSAIAAMETNRYGEEGTDVIPDEVLFQCQQQMAVMGWELVDVCVFFGVFRMRIYPVQRNDVIIEAISEAEQELAQRIINGDRPDPEWTHPNARRLISEVHGFRANVVTQLDEDALELWLSYQSANEKIKRLEKVKEECRNRLVFQMDGAEVGRFPRGTKELKRTIIKDSLYTESDVAKVHANIGKVKRRGHERLTERKVK